MRRIRASDGGKGIVSACPVLTQYIAGFWPGRLGRCSFKSPKWIIQIGEMAVVACANDVARVITIVTKMPACPSLLYDVTNKCSAPGMSILPVGTAKFSVCWLYANGVPI
jgi:hypothetical protein